MESQKFTTFNKPHSAAKGTKEKHGIENNIDCITDDDDFCEFVPPLKKRPKKNADLRTYSKNEPDSVKNSQTNKSFRKTKILIRKEHLQTGPSSNFAKKLKDRMKNNTMDMGHKDDSLNVNPKAKLQESSMKSTQISQQHCEDLTPIKSECNNTTLTTSTKTVESHNATVLAENADNSENPDFFGLPMKIKSLFWVHRSISDLYDWQKKCLQLECNSSGSNLIYSLPTSGGKTMVAEILMMKQVICKQKNALFILPFVAIVQEKMRSLAPFGIDLNFLVEEYAGSKGKLPPLRHRRKSIYVATIEKAASLVNSLIENDRLDEIGLVVVDELHMIGEGGSRGSTLESTLTKIMFSSPTTQLVGMSATLNNIEDLKKFLNALLYVDNFRPVELKEYVKISDGIYGVDKNAEDKLEFLKFVSFKDLYTKESQKLDPDHILGLVMEVVPKDSCLIFCSTKKICENVAQLLCNLMPSSVKAIKLQERSALLKNMKVEEGFACPILERTIMFGVAYHHSGLTNEERKLIEEAYLEGVISVITCTSTLAAGVNLPAKRVILRCPYVGREFMSRTQYKQMVGRAGRAGFHSSGESYLISSNADQAKILDLLGDGSEECHSSLLHEGSKGLSSVILSSIGLKMVSNTHEMAQFLKRTLCHIQLHKHKDVDLTAEANSCLKGLIDDGYISQKVSTEGILKLDVTKLGRAIFKGSIDPKLGKKLYADLNRNLSGLVLSSHLHLLYAVTPYETIGHTEVHWMTYLNETFGLSAEEITLMSILGISETYLNRKASGMSSRNVGADVEEVAKRFYLTLMLNVLLKKESVWEVASKFQVTRGFIQNLLSSAATFASSVLHFCQELDDLWPYQNLLPNFIKKLSYCCSMELVPLLEISGVKIGRARLLYNAGFTSPQQIAQSSVEQLVHGVQLMPRKVAKLIIASAQMLVKEKLEDLIHEVRELVPIPEIGSQLDASNASFFNDTLDLINISQL